jgi:hypothetical protein
MLALTLVVLSLPAQIGTPRGVHLLDDAPLLAQATEVAPPPLVPAAEPAQSDAQVSAQQLQVDLDALKKQRPSLGGGIALVSAGGSVAIVGVLYLAVSPIAFFGTGINPFLILGAVGLGIGLPLVAIGVWLLYNRLEERKHIDEESARLKKELQQRQPQRVPSYVPPTSPTLPPSPSDLPPPQVLGPEPTILLAHFG